MFNIGALELLLVLLVAFLVVGPKDLPKVARWIARQVKSIRRLVREIKKETGWDEFSKELRDTTDDIKQTMKEADIRREFQDTAQEIKTGMDDVRQEMKSAAKDVDEVAHDL